jgi:PAS domain S-box-containing protein
VHAIVHPDISQNDIRMPRETTPLEARFGAALEAAPDAIVLVDDAGTVVLVNTAVEQLFGYRRDELVGQFVDVLVPDRLRSSHGAHRSRFAADPRRRPMGIGQELWARRKDGTEFPAEISLSPVEVGEQTLVMAAVRDITERLRQAEIRREIAERAAAAELLARHADELERSNAEIRRLNEELEQRVADRTSQLEAANRELEGFTYSVSHDLRAPIRQIDGFSQMLVEEFGAVLDAKALRYLRRIQDGAKHMGQLVDDLLNLARVGRQALWPRRVALDTVVHGVVVQLQADTADRDIRWNVQSLPAIECDPGLMEIVFRNLLENAVKYTRTRQPAVIEVGHAQRRGGRVAIYVRDNGVGFDMKYADQLFGVFQRLHRVEEFEGTGVGLATVQRIVHKHGGEVWAEGEPDRGASFYFTLPSSGAVAC